MNQLLLSSQQIVYRLKWKTNIYQVDLRCVYQYPRSLGNRLNFIDYESVIIDAIIKVYCLKWWMNIYQVNLRCVYQYLSSSGNRLNFIDYESVIIVDYKMFIIWNDGRIFINQNCMIVNIRLDLCFK